MRRAGACARTRCRAARPSSRGWDRGARRTAWAAWQAAGWALPSRSLDSFLVSSWARAKLYAPDRSRTTDNIPAPAPPPELPTRTRSRKHTVLAVVLSTVAVLIAAVVIAGFLIRLPYVIISPGSATPLDSHVVQIDGAQTYPKDSGNLLFLTVQVSTREPNVWRVVTSWLDPDRDVEKRSDVQGCLTDE